METLLDYVAARVEDYDRRSYAAWGKIDRMHSRLLWADFELFCDIREAIDEYCDKHGLDPDEFDPELCI